MRSCLSYSPTLLDYVGLLGTLVSPDVELMLDVDVAVLTDLIGVAVEAPRRWSAVPSPVDVVEPPVARAEKQPPPFVHLPAHRTSQVGAGAGEYVEGLLGFVNLVLAERRFDALPDEGG